MSTDDLAALGERVEQARILAGWSKEHAAREAGISAITWKRVEDGLSVHDTKRAAVLRVLGLSGEPKLSVGGPSEDADTLLYRRPPGLSDSEWERLRSTTRDYIEWQLEQASKER